MSNDRPRAVVLTGAFGFVGRYILAELLKSCQRYDKIFALDLCPADAIAGFVEYSPNIVPLQLDLSLICDLTSLEHAAIKSLLSHDVSCVIHIAGLVDTRESDNIRAALRRINFDVTKALVDLSIECRVERFIYMSSGSSQVFKSETPMYPSYYKYLFPKSMYGGMLQATYAATKLQAEEYVLSIGKKEKMITCVIRPQAVWGRYDTISTESMLTWPKWLPHILIGDPCNPMTFCRADSLAKYVLLVDNGIILNPKSMSGRGFDVSDGQVSSLLKQTARLVRNTNCISGTTPRGLLWKLLRALGICEKDGDDSNAVHVIIMPKWIVNSLILCTNIVDSLFMHKKSWQFLRLLTANNLAYCSEGVLTNPTLQTYKEDCVHIFEMASKTEKQSSFEDYLCHYNMTPTNDAEILKKDKLPELFRTIAANSVLNARSTLPLPNSLVASTPLNLGPLSLPNRVIKAATFECMCDHRGVPTEELIRYHERQIIGGVGMTVVAYGGVSSDGRSFPTQICLRSSDQSISSETEFMLRRLCEAVHAAGGLACLQITHAGAFADPKCNGGATARGPSAIFNPLTMLFSKSLENDEESLARIVDDFVHAVTVCRRVGFDAVELHLGHGYLLSQFLSRRTNPYHAYDPDARLAFPLRVLKAVVACAHSKRERYLAVLVKHNVSELTEEDLPLADTRKFAAAFISAGADLLVPSGGHVMTNGLHMLRGGRPIEAMARAQSNPLKKFVLRFFGEYLIAPEVFREAFFRERVLSVMLGAGVPLSKVVLVGGIHNVRTAESAVRCYGFAAVELGRVLLADPDWCKKVGIAGRSSDLEKIRECDRSNQCIVGTTMALTPLKCIKHACQDW